jgi:hypothetical protein
MPKGSIAIFTNTVITRRGDSFRDCQCQGTFREHVIATWRESGGEPDGALQLPDCLGRMVCDSLRKAASLPPPERLHVAMACHIHRDLSERLIEMGESIASSPSKSAPLSRAQKKIQCPMLTLVLRNHRGKIANLRFRYEAPTRPSRSASPFSAAMTCAMTSSRGIPKCSRRG